MVDSSFKSKHLSRVKHIKKREDCVYKWVIFLNSSLITAVFVFFILIPLSI